MKSLVQYLMCSVALLVAVVSEAAPTPNAPAPVNSPSKESTILAPRHESYSDFSIISEKNIFMRDRTRHESSTRPSSYSTTQSTHKSVEQSLVLTGIVFEDGLYHAYVEDVANEKILRLAPGDSVAHGTVERIDIDALQYEQNGHPQWVEIGSDFTGHPYLAFDTTNPSSSGDYGSSSGNSGGPTSQPAINPNDPNLSVEQRMRLRAQQERNAGRR